jgi:HAD superfamily hydrolase (TIGR01549 family)
MSTPLKVFTGTAGWELKRDAEFVLETLKWWQDEAGGPKLGVISNFDERLPTLLDALGISHYFDFILTSRECGMEKPSKQIFDIALTRLGITERNKAVHVGDSFDKDVRGASSAGWGAVLIKVRV